MRAAFAAGAAAAVVDEAHAVALRGLPCLYVVDDVQRGLERLGAAARERSEALVVAVTGSVGKTSTKEALRLVLADEGATHASVASYNNHWGVPLTLARMPADTRFGIFEIGMNHAGEIEPLAAQVHPQIAIVTNVAAVHLENFASVGGIADAKGEIFSGLVRGGVAIINRDIPTYDRLWRRAEASPAGHILTFGEHEDADARLDSFAMTPEGSAISATILGQRLDLRLAAPGRHLALNAMAVLLAARAAGVELEAAAATLARFTAGQGRGARSSCKRPMARSPSSTRATTPIRPRCGRPSRCSAPPRRRAPAGGSRCWATCANSVRTRRRCTRALHDDILANAVDLVFAAGPLCRGLFESLPSGLRGLWGETAPVIEEPLAETIRAGDVVMVKGLQREPHGSRRRRSERPLRRRAGPPAPARRCSISRCPRRRTAPAVSALRGPLRTPMLTWLTELSGYFSPLNLFRYLTFRTIGATATAAFFVFFFGPSIIAALRLKQGKGQPIRLDGPQSHLLTKKGTPTMGGLMILSGLVVSTLLWANLRSPYVWITLLVTLGFGMIGFYDDYLKVTRQSHAGFSGRARLAIEALIAAVACWAMMAVGPTSTTGLALPSSTATSSTSVCSSSSSAPSSSWGSAMP